jgi:hypothetical protein
MKIMANNLEYNIWQSMKQRCYDSNHKAYNHYGGRGIAMCEEWRTDFWKFLEDMGKRPSKLHSIDRINVNGNYEPDNCRWATMKEQQNNRRNNVLLTYNNKTQTQAQWANELGISEKTISSRLALGWSISEVFGLKEHLKVCDYCNFEFSYRGRQKYCSPKCRANNWYHRQKVSL